MKRILIAIMFVVGLSGTAQATVIYLKCGSKSTAIDLKKKKIVESTIFDKVRFSETKIILEKENSDFSYEVNRIDLSYFNQYDIKEGYCLMGRKF